MKGLLIIFIIFILNGCGIGTLTEYRIRDVEQGYNMNRGQTVYLTQEIVKGKDKIGKIFLDISMGYDNFNKIVIRSGKGNNYIDEKILPFEIKYEHIELVNGVTITKKNGEKVKISQNKIEYTYKKDPNTDYKAAIVRLSEDLSGPIILELGKIKIGGEEYDTPKIYIQKHKKTESWSLIGSILSTDSNEIGPLYRGENWIED